MREDEVDAILQQVGEEFGRRADGEGEAGAGKLFLEIGDEGR
jgi:hypothetical protein